MKKHIGLKEFRADISTVTRQVKKGESFVVYRHSTPLFRVTPIDADDQWEEMIDFTSFRKGGVRIEDLLKRI